MNHNMRLHDEPFDRIKSGNKKIEYRLNAEKRRQIKIGDKITFTKRTTGEDISVIVTDMKYYSSLLEMYSATFDEDFKGRYNCPEEVVDDTPYYTEDEVKKYGCVAIYFDLIN